MKEKKTTVTQKFDDKEGNKKSETKKTNSLDGNDITKETTTSLSVGNISVI